MGFDYIGHPYLPVVIVATEEGLPVFLGRFVKGVWRIWSNQSGNAVAGCFTNGQSG